MLFRVPLTRLAYARKLHPEWRRSLALGQRGKGIDPMEQERHTQATFMRRLAHDTTANTLVIAAAAMVPILAMVGSGIDASRYYMTAARLQAACDAGALAARQAMTTATFTTAHRQTGLNFFDQNFEDGIFGTTNRQRDFTSNGDGVVHGTASARLPTTIMQIFGFDDFNLSVTCSADVNISNTDIVFALDTTGSMNCPEDNFTSCPNGNNNNVEASNSRIRALRIATMNFFDTVKAATSPSAQVRFGFVPYGHNVNVINVIPRTMLASSHTYQSRRWISQQISYQAEWIPRSTSNLGTTNTSLLRYNNNSNGTAIPSEKTLCETTNRGTFRVGDVLYEISGNVYTLNAFSGTSTATNKAGCRANVRRIREVYRYEPRTFDVSAFRTGGNVVTDTGDLGANQTHTWNGCIEEAATVNTGTWNPMPANAFDMDINLVPTTEAQRWKPSLPDIIYRRQSGSTWVTTPIETFTTMSGPLSYRCPVAARRLGDISRTDLQNFVNSLSALGSTYHAMGMVWAGRVISPRGMFAADNTSAPNGDPIARHVVFMTDGLLNETNVHTYTPWGMEFWDRRVTDAGDTLQSHERHAARLQAVCDAIKRENITLWIVSMNPTLTQEMINCASPGRAYRAVNGAQLNAAFQEIAQKIAALRLTS